MARLIRIAVLLLAGVLSDGVKAQDFSARFSMVETGLPRIEMVPAMETLGGTLPLRPSLPTVLAGWNFDDHSFVAFGTYVGASQTTLCGAICEISLSPRVEATLGVGSGAALAYFSGGFTVRGTQASHMTFTAPLSEMWTAGIGFTYQASRTVRFWGQIDRVGFSQEVFGSFAGVPATGFAVKTGFYIPLGESFFGDSRAIVAADAASRRGFWGWLKGWLAPGKFMPQ